MRSAAATYAAHRRLESVHPALVADRVARHHELVTARGKSLAITTASAVTARVINEEVQRRRNLRGQGASVALADGTQAFVGDRVVTRRNDAGLVTDGGSLVRNRQSWTVTEVDEDGSFTVADPAVTGYGNQGVTTEHGICVVEPSSSRAGIYVGMTRGRGRNRAWVVDRTGLADAEDAFAAAIARPANALTAHAVRAQLGGEVPEPVMNDESQRILRRLDRLRERSRSAPGLGL